MPEHGTGTPEVGQAQGWLEAPLKRAVHAPPRRPVRAGGRGNLAAWLRPGLGGGRHRGGDFQDAWAPALTCGLLSPPHAPPLSTGGDHGGPRPERGEEGEGRGVGEVDAPVGRGRPGRREGNPQGGAPGSRLPTA